MPISSENTYIARIADSLLNKSALDRKVLIILGARQVGKTTLVKRFLAGKKAAYFNLDVEVDKDRFLAIASLPPLDAMKSLNFPDYIVIDEAQRKPETARIIKGWHDSEVKAKMILLGSSSINLLNQSAESLTGRNEKIFLPPLAFREVVRSKEWSSEVFSDQELQEKFASQIRETLLQSLVFGNYPEAVVVADKEPFLLNLVSDYLLKDVLQLGLIKEPDLIKRLLLNLAYQIGSEVSVNELSRSIGISRITIEKYLNLLEETYVIFSLPAWSTNKRKEISKNRKIFFWDTGIRNALIKEFSLNPARADIGPLWENWTIAEFAKKNLLEGQKKNLYFWRARSGGEVDLVITKGSVMEAFEIKWKSQKRSFAAFENQYGVKVKIITSAMPLI